MTPKTQAAGPGGQGGRTRRLPGRNRRSEPAAPLRLADLDPFQRRLALVRMAATIVLSWVLIFGAYFALPIGRESGLRALLRLGADIALLGVVFFWQVRRISVAELPELRAVEALGVVIALFLVSFSGLYLALSHESVRTFTQDLDHVKALYFTITIFSTVGFGDITPTTDGARVLVSTQMMLDLLIIGAVVRVLFNAARSRVAPTGEAGSS
ncbi:MAG TPA: potassium channel family protein [Acidimicrobiales bacterium]|nr:potassium channel family protein [Acidimicrobiales bacterium]